MWGNCTRNLRSSVEGIARPTAVTWRGTGGEHYHTPSPSFILAADWYGCDIVLMLFLVACLMLRLHATSQSTHSDQLVAVFRPRRALYLINDTSKLCYVCCTNIDGIPLVLCQLVWADPFLSPPAPAFHFTTSYAVLWQWQQSLILKSTSATFDVNRH